jgi:hypothetical protein
LNPASTQETEYLTVLSQESVRVTLRLAPNPLRLTARIFSQMNTCGHSPYITSSLTRGDESVIYNCCGTRQRIHSRIRVPWDSRPYFTVPDSGLFASTLHGPNIKHYSQQFLCCCLHIRCRGNLFTEPLPNNAYLLWLHYFVLHASSQYKNYCLLRSETL